MRLSTEDHARVTAAVSAAERITDGEIVTIVAGHSDSYDDVALHYAMLLAFLALAVVTALPGLFVGIVDRVDGWEQGWSREALLAMLLPLLAFKFAIGRFVLGWMPLRMKLTPRGLKTRRVRTRAIDYFKVGTEQRTEARVGVLLYLSLAEHRAEIVADAAIHSVTTPECWGEAMAALVAELRQGRAGEGMAAAVERIGAVLAQHFPKTAGDRNELPDRLIEL